jgi:predicted DNA-binding transcriptional regulator AlpA
MTACDTDRPTRPHPTPPGMLRRQDAARFCSLGASSWDRYTAAGLNPAPIRLGGAVLWSADELSAWIRHGCPPRAEWTPRWAALRGVK